MSKTILAQIIVICLAHDGYRRAGIEFKKGENLIETDQLSDAQLGQIKADARLNIVDAKETPAETDPAKNSQGTVDPNSLDLTKFSQAVAQLEKDSESDFTKDGKPQLNALEFYGVKVKSKERDELWKAYLAAQPSSQQADLEKGGE